MTLFHPPQDAFDFSKEAKAFEDKLWMQLKKAISNSDIQPLSDDDLAWVNAAGVPHSKPDTDDTKR